LAQLKYAGGSTGLLASNGMLLEGQFAGSPVRLLVGGTH
jgi:hypothetical protein